MTRTPKMPGSDRVPRPGVGRPRKSAAELATDGLGIYRQPAPEGAPLRLEDLPLRFRRAATSPRRRQVGVDPCGVIGCGAAHGHEGKCPARSESSEPAGAGHAR